MLYSLSLSVSLSLSPHCPLSLSLSLRVQTPTYTVKKAGWWARGGSTHFSVTLPNLRWVTSHWWNNWQGRTHNSYMYSVLSSGCIIITSASVCIHMGTCTFIHVHVYCTNSWIIFCVILYTLHPAVCNRHTAGILLLLVIHELYVVYTLNDFLVCVPL